MEDSIGGGEVAIKARRENTLGRIPQMDWRLASVGPRFSMQDQALKLNLAAESKRTRWVKEGIGGFASVPAGHVPALLPRVVRQAFQLLLDRLGLRLAPRRHTSVERHPHGRPPVRRDR